MVFGIGALASLGLALPTGMMFGYGYGYGVRAGYSAFKKPSEEVQKLKLSSDPVQGALGAGLQSAEERTGVALSGGIPKQMGMTTEPSIRKNVQTVAQPEMISNIDGSRHITRSQKNQMTRAEYRQWFHKSKYTPRNRR